MTNRQGSIALSAWRAMGPAALLLMPAAGRAQNDNPAAGIAGCAACSGVLAIPIVAVVVNILLLVWVAKDAKSRGMDNAVLWMLLVFFTSLIGLVIYLLARPQGNLVECPNCHNKKLQVAARCPHCGV